MAPNMGALLTGLGPSRVHATVCLSAIRSSFGVFVHKQEEDPRKQAILEGSSENESADYSGIDGASRTASGGFSPR